MLESESISLVKASKEVGAFSKEWAQGGLERYPVGLVILGWWAKWQNVVALVSVMEVFSGEGFLEALRGRRAVSNSWFGSEPYFLEYFLEGFQRVVKVMVVVGLCAWKLYLQGFLSQLLEARI